MNIVALDPGFPGAGRVLLELAKMLPKDVMYCSPQTVMGRPAGWTPPTQAGEWLFLPAWTSEYTRMEGFGKKVVVWTSPLLQSEMVPQELEYISTIRRLLSANKLYGVWFGDPSWLSLFKGYRVFSAPYPVSLPEHVVLDHKQREEELQLSLFGPMHPRKNVLVQAVAAKLLGATLHLTDRSAEPILDLVGARYVPHGWLDYSSYDRLFDLIDVGLQASVPGVESFSYVTWDHVSRGVPCLSTVEWVPLNLQVRQPSNPQAIAEAVKNVGGMYWGSLRRWAEDRAKARNQLCREALENFGIKL